MPKTAFLVLKSPQELDPTHLVKRFADKTEASIVLVEDGIYQALLPASAQRLAAVSHEVLVSSEDVEARGFTSSDLKIGKAVNYPEIVECIMERTERTVTI